MYCSVLHEVVYSCETCGSVLLTCSNLYAYNCLHDLLLNNTGSLVPCWPCNTATLAVHEHLFQNVKPSASQVNSGTPKTTNCQHTA
jgi:hypothetical protein